jgi:hypothetical protein
MMRSVRIVLTIVAVAIVVPALSGDGQLPKNTKHGQSKKVSELMRKKLQHARRYWKGLL